MDTMAGICLLIQGIWDIRKKEIPLWISVGLGSCSLLYSLCCQRDWLSLCLALIPGVICLLLGYCTRQAIGYGDGILLCSLGMLYSLEEVISIFAVASLFAGVVGLFLLVVFQKSRRYEVPFVPFLFAGWLVFHAADMVKGVIL